MLTLRTFLVVELLLGYDQTDMAYLWNIRLTSESFYYFVGSVL